MSHVIRRSVEMRPSRTSSKADADMVVWRRLTGVVWCGKKRE